MVKQGYRKMTPAELIDSGYSPKSSRYLSPTGESISRRKYDDIAAKDSGFDTAQQRRDVQRHSTAYTKGRSPAQRESDAIKESWRTNATRRGISPRIKDNAEYQEFRLRMKDHNAAYGQYVKDYGKDGGRKEWRRERLDIFLYFDLISDEEYETYLAEM